MTDTLERDTTSSTAPRKQRWGWVLAVVLLGALALTVSGVVPFRQLIEQRRAVEEGRQQLAALEDENRILEEDVAALYTDEEIERVARDQYGLVRPGETGYVIVSPPGEEPIADEAAVPVEEAHRPWWVRFWDWVTGNDLRRDG
jgi:cell division protein FtsB